jgi:hypothetical protein
MPPRLARPAPQTLQDAFTDILKGALKLAERSYGAFHRVIALPPGVDGARSPAARRESPAGESRRAFITGERD